MKIDEKCDFDGVSELQWTIKNFLWVASSYNKYLKFISALFVSLAVRRYLSNLGVKLQPYNTIF